MARHRAPIAGPRRRSRCRFEKRVAVGRITVSSPSVLRPLASSTLASPTPSRSSRSTSFSAATCARSAHPIGADPERFHLIAPYETDPRKWEQLPWIDQYSGKRYRITASGPTVRGRRARTRAMATCCASTSSIPKLSAPMLSGAPCRQANHRAPQPPPRRDRFDFIGKESNKLEEVEEGSLPTPATSTPSIPIRGATSGKPSGCRCCDLHRFPAADARRVATQRSMRPGQGALFSQGLRQSSLPDCVC